MIARTLNAKGGSGRMDGDTETFVTAFAQNTRDEVREIGGNIAGALAAQPGMKQQTYLRTGMAVRRLLPIECEKLQGFPPGWTQFGEHGEEIADGPRYRMLGNAVCVPVVEWIARRIVQAEKS